MRRLIIALLVILLTPCIAETYYSSAPGMGTTEQDGSPDIQCIVYVYDNGTVTDNGDGTCGIAGGSGGAPANATYLLQTPDGALASAQAMSALASGIVYNTTVTGVQSIATAGTDYVIPAGNVATATALAADPSDCGANVFATAIDTGANLTCSAIVDADVPDNITIDLAAAATALNADPTDCGANVFATSIAASGNLTCSAIVDADVPDNITIDLAAAATALNADPTDCGAGEYATAIAASGNLTCGALTTESTTAGRSLTLSTFDVAADAELYTDQSGAYIEVPIVEDMNDMFSTMNALTVTRIWCTTDAGTVTLNIENASDADMLSADLVCDVGGQSSCGSGCDVDTIQGANDNLAAYAFADVSISAVDTAVRVSLYMGYTLDD